MNFNGIIIGVLTFLIIGLYHPLVIKGEYWFSKKIWPLFAIAGIGMLALSLLLQNDMAATICAVAGGGSLWSIKELKEQHGRVAKGWFPENPARSGKTGNSGESGPADRRNR